MRGGVLIFYVHNMVSLAVFFGAGAVAPCCGWPFRCGCGVAVAGGGGWCGCSVAVAGAGVYDRIPKVVSVCVVSMAREVLCLSSWCVTCLFACSIAWLLVYAEFPKDDSS